MLALLVTPLANAQRFRRSYNYQPSNVQYITPETAASPYTGNAKECKDAIKEVNVARVARGLKPFINDPLLNQAAYSAAVYRASRLINGHVEGNRGDFQFLPEGANCNTAGCGALEPSWGWGACGTYENYTYVGCAWVMGRDGKRYMHQFLR